MNLCQVTINQNIFTLFSQILKLMSTYAIGTDGKNGFPLNTPLIASITESVFFFTVDMHPLI